MMKHDFFVRFGLGAIVFFTLILGSVVGAEDYALKPQILDALTRHDTTTALQLLDSEIQTDPGFAPNYLVKGKILFEREKYDQALEFFTTALEKKSKLYEALYYKSLILLEKDQLKEAEKAINNGLKRAKDEEALFHNAKGLLLLKQEDYIGADVEFRQALRLDSTNSNFRVNLGDANYFQQIYPLAINEYKQVIETDTTNLTVFFRLARAYMAMKNFNEALDALRTVLSRDTMYAKAWQEAGKLYTMAGLSARDPETKEQRFKETIGSYRKYLELSGDSANGEVFFNLGRAYFNLGGFAQADSAFLHVLSLDEEPKNIYLYLGRGHIAEEKYQQGIDFLKQHLAGMKADDPDWQPTGEDADLFRRMGDAYKALSEHYYAAENYVMASDLAPDNSRYAVEAALAFHQQKEYEKALEYYQRRMENGEPSWNIYMNAAYCTLNLEDFEQSIEYLKEVVTLDSSQVKAYELLSDTYLRQMSDCQNGVEWTEKLLAMDPTNCDAHKMLGFAYFGGTCPANYLKAVSHFNNSMKCYKEKGMDGCANSDLMLYIAQAYHLQAAELSESDKKEDSKKYFKLAFDTYKNVLKCDPGNAEAKKGVSDTEFEF